MLSARKNNIYVAYHRMTSQESTRFSVIAIFAICGRESDARRVNIITTMSRVPTPKVRKTGAVKRALFKLGTNIVTRDSGALDVETITDLVDQLASAHGSGLEVVIVSSGAVGAGMDTLISRLPANRGRLRRRNVTARQAAAAIGQVDVIALYKSLFDKHGIEVAQTLLSRSVLNQREGYLNVRGTMEMLLEAGIVPIVNENDVVAVEEIVGVTYGDNDRMSAMLANVLDADLLVLLGEMNGLHTADPHNDRDAELISDVYEISDEIRSFAGGPSDDRGSGGMRSKLEAAEVAMRSGIDMIIADGHVEAAIRRLLAGEKIGTRFHSLEPPAESRKRWLLTGGTEAKGAVTIDDGAVRALTHKGNSLLPVGVTHVEGEFERGDIIGVKSLSGRNVAWGLSNYSASETRLVMGKRSSELPDILDSYFGREIVHRNNMALGVSVDR